MKIDCLGYSAQHGDMKYRATNEFGATLEGSLGFVLENCIVCKWCEVQEITVKGYNIGDEVEVEI